MATGLILVRRLRGKAFAKRLHTHHVPTLPTVRPAAPHIQADVLPLTVETMALLEDSIPDSFTLASTAEVFYTQLFALAPSAKPLFGPAHNQLLTFSRMLAGTQSFLAARSLTSFESLRALGQRHVAYGAKLSHFSAIKRAFIYTIETVDQQTIEGRQSELDEPVDRVERLLRVGRAWEALLYIVVGEMGPAMLLAEHLKEFHVALASDLAAPSGGTCAALSGAQGAALLIMSAELTRAHAHGTRERMLIDEATSQLRDVVAALEQLACMDMTAYCRVMSAVRQPPLTAPAARTAHIAQTLEDASRVPLQVAEYCAYALRIARALIPLAAISGVGDAGAGILLLIACGRTAVQNCAINTGAKLAQNASWRPVVASRAQELKCEIAALDAELEIAIERRLGV